MSRPAHLPESETAPPGAWGRLAQLVSARRTAWVLLVLAVIVTGALFSLTPPASESAPNSLPDEADSQRIQQVLDGFEGSDQAPVIAVATRAGGGALEQSDLGALTQLRAAMLEVDRGVGDAPEQGPPVVPSEDGEAAIALVPVDAELSGAPLNDLVGELREVIADEAPEGLDVQLTGGPAFGADIANAFEGADFRLLGVTAAVVAVLLLITYRSPVLWLVPLIVIGTADRLAAIVSAVVADWFGFALDGSTTGITSVLVFGAGTNYALLIVSRYREELRRQDDHRLALREAVRRAGPAVLASNITVVLALLVLLLAVGPNTQALGLSAAVGLLVALVYLLFVLPPALSLTGRRLFWPFIPRVGQEDRSGSGPWYRIASAVRHRPVVFGAVTALILVVCAFGLSVAKIGLTQTEQFRVEAESVSGFEQLAEHFPQGLSNPTTVVARTDAAGPVQQKLEGAAGVESVQPTGTSSDGWSQFQVVLDSAPASAASLETIEGLRADLADVDGAEALVGGADAQALDTRDGAERDLMLIVPLILALILVVLIVLLRALVAPLLLISATVLSTLAAIGAGSWLSTEVFGFPALDYSVPLFAFLFLVALGIDYTIFLATRAREETPGHGTREGVVRAVALTGGVITSAGVVLAAVFVVLGVLPLITLTQLGIIVSLGILLDTFVVRTLVVPALFSIVGERIWWPSKVH